MRVVVTGASGFVGTALVRALAARGDDVVATDRLEPIEALPVVRFVAADLREPRGLEGLFDGAEVVYHMAAVSSIARAPEGLYQGVNVDGTEHVLRLAYEAGVRRAVYMSSSTVYGIPEVVPQPEEAVLRPMCAYSRSKVNAEAVAQRWGRRADMNVAIIRPRVVVGRGRAGIFALFFTFIRMGLPVPLIGGGRNLFQFTAIDDLLDACLLAAADDSPGAPQVYNIGSDVERTLGQELETLIGHAGSRSRLVPVPARPVAWVLDPLYRVGLSPLVPEQYLIADADFVLDTAKARRRLGFTPKHANADGMMAAWDWWMARGAEHELVDLVRWWKPRRQNALQRRG